MLTMYTCTVIIAAQLVSWSVCGLYYTLAFKKTIEVHSVEVHKHTHTHTHTHSHTHTHTHTQSGAVISTLSTQHTISSMVFTTKVNKPAAFINYKLPWLLGGNSSG